MKRSNNTCKAQRVSWLVPVALLSLAIAVFGQETVAQSNQSTPAPGAQAQGAGTSPGTGKGPVGNVKTSPQAVPESKQQPKRILGIMPNYRAVSAGAIPPPPTLKESFNIAAENSFDYSAFVFTGLTSAIADAEDAHKQLCCGVPGYWAYAWRGFVDKTDGNYLVIFALPTIFHQDERYYAMGTGPKGKRALYAATRVLITPNYHGRNSFNGSELFGRAIAQGISATYYPSSDRTASELASKWAYAVMRDSLTNVFREFWPDIATHVLHRHP